MRHRETFDKDMDEIRKRLAEFNIQDEDSARGIEWLMLSMVRKNRRMKGRIKCREAAFSKLHADLAKANKQIRNT